MNIVTVSNPALGQNASVKIGAPDEGRIFRIAAVVFSFNNGDAALDDMPQVSIAYKGFSLTIPAPIAVPATKTHVIQMMQNVGSRIRTTAHATLDELQLQQLPFGEYDDTVTVTVTNNGNGPAGTMQISGLTIWWYWLRSRTSRA